MSDRKDKWLVAASASAFVIAIMIVAWFKYRHLGYNGFDLSIYNQTFWNTIHGRFFENSINPPNYLGDHAEWPILILAPFYALVPHPLTLILLQAAAIAGSAFLIRLFAKDVNPRTGFRWMFVGLWLANPFVWNLALDEFHIIVFAIPLIILAAYGYRKRRYAIYLPATLGLALVREDMFIVVLGFAAMITWDWIRRRWNSREVLSWALVPTILSAAIFIIDQIAAKLASPVGYKFLIYYNWLGNGVFSILWGALVHPLMVIKHVLTFGTFSAAITMLLPFMFLPLWRRRWLLVAAAPAVEFLLTRTGVDVVIVRTQYMAPFLPLFFLAAVEGYETIRRYGQLVWRIIPRAVFPIVLSVSSVIIWFYYGPGTGIATAFSTDNERIKALKDAVAIIPSDAPVMGTMDTMAVLSSRRWLFPLGCVWIGKKQFGIGDYTMPRPPEYIIVDEHDLLYLTTIVPQINWVQSIYPSFAGNLRKVLAEGNFGVVYESAGVALLKRGVGGDWPLVNVRHDPKIEHPAKLSLGPLAFLGWSDKDNKPERRLYFSAPEKVIENLIMFVNGRPSILGNGLYPTSEWNRKEIVEVELDSSPPQMELRLAEAKGWVVVNGDGSQTLTLPKINFIGDKVTAP